MPPRHSRNNGKRRAAEAASSSREKRAKAQSTQRYFADPEPEFDSFPAPSDVDGYIRCLEQRVEAGYYSLQPVLDKFLETRKNRRPIGEGEPEGLSDLVYHRIKTLSNMREDYREGAPQLENIDAILAAYRSGRLEAETGKVSYWLDGRQLCDPKPENIKEEIEEAKKYRMTEGRFWVEIPAPYIMAPCFTVPAQNDLVYNMKLHMIKIHIRLPGAQGNGLEWDFMDDTGSNLMTIYQDDLVTLGNMSGITPLASAPVDVLTAKGPGRLVTTYLEVNLLDPSNSEKEFLGPWIQIRAAVFTGAYDPYTDPPRLNGNWMRQLYYQGSAPTNSLDLVISTNKTGIASNLPKVHPCPPHGPWIVGLAATAP